MGRRLRTLTRPDALVEVVQRTFQGRFLIKPGPRMNAVIVGALAKAQQTHSVEIHGGACLSGHLHLLVTVPTVKAMAGFMRDFTRKLSIESGKIHDWSGPTFPNRYHSTEISEESEAQLSRLIYCLRNGTKENLVGSPLDWPGVPFAEAMISGEPLRGIWIDRTAFFQAKNRGEDVSLADFTEHLELHLAPLPCFEHLDDRRRRSSVIGLIRQIEEETAARHRVEGTVPLGVEAVLAADPHSKPESFERSPQPWFHTFSKSSWHEMKEALGFIVAAYQEAAKQLKEGNFAVAFPENTFPPARPFVEPTWAMKAPAPEQLQPG